jgi:CubicO group peptidase (beta-lactamase class C family)
MIRRVYWCPVRVLLVVALATSAASAAPVSLDATLEPYLGRYGLPAVAAAVARNGAVVAAGAVGTRRFGTDAPVTLDDRFHLGSDTKAMTALLAAMLVEQGRLRWDSTVGEVFPELAGRMAPGLATVTLTQLLSHTSGVASDNQAFTDILERSLSADGNLDEIRYWVVREWSPQKLVSAPGTTFAYANMNYVLVGAMIERVDGRTWDELIVDRVFTPLGLRSAGLGNQASLGRVDAPLGHDPSGATPKAMLAGPNGDNPPVIGPAGIAHMSVLDFARWAAWNAGQGARAPALVQPDTLRRLHTPVIGMTLTQTPKPGTPPGGRYALGWGELTMDWAGRPLLFHGGSNGMNVAHIWVDPVHDSAMVLMTNIGGERAEEGLRDAAAELYGRYLAADAAPLPTTEPTAVPAGAAAPAKRRGSFAGDTRRGARALLGSRRRAR